MKNKEPTKNLGGRPKKTIDYKAVEKLAKMMCTQEEIGSYLDISARTLQKDEEFLRIFKKGIDEAKMSVRRMQYKSAQEGSTTMLIWLGKQYLGQRDKQEVDSTANMNITIKLEPVRRSDNGKDNPSQ